MTQRDRAIDTGELFRRSQGGDIEAFGALYEHLRPRIHRFVSGRIRQGPMEADDFTSEIFVRAFKNKEKYQARGVPFEAWLFGIARNCVIDEVRKYKRLKLESSLEVMPEVADRRKRFEELIGVRSELDPALAALPPQQREVIELRFLDGFSLDETAAMLGKTYGSVRQNQLRGLIRLKSFIKASRQKENMDLVEKTKNTTELREEGDESVSQDPVPEQFSDPGLVKGVILDATPDKAGVSGL